jgi:heme exporter protein A
MTLSQVQLETVSPGSTRPAIEIRGLSMAMDERKILHDINLTIGDGEFVAILGANGAGKSTLLKILATLASPTTGSVELFGRPLVRSDAGIRRKIGLIGHQSMLYRDLSALENLQFFARLYGHGLKDGSRLARQMLDMVGLTSRANDPIKSFSRGMTQRITIARALLHDPQVLLADEPFAGLDAPSAVALEQLLSDLHATRKTIVLVNHDIEQSLRLSQRVVVLRGGRVVLDSPASQLWPDEVLAEVTP